MIAQFNCDERSASLAIMKPMVADGGQGLTQGSAPKDAGAWHYSPCYSFGS